MKITEEPIGWRNEDSTKAQDFQDSRDGVEDIIDPAWKKDNTSA